MSRALFAGLMVVLFTGCVTHKPDMTDHFPAGLEVVCQQQVTRAKLAIERCGTPLTKKCGVSISLHRGERKINGMWCWQLSQGSAFWVAGVTTYSATIEVGCNPQTLGEVSTEVLYHESGHYWLGTNCGIYSHDPKYDPAFHWSSQNVMLIREGKDSKATYDGPENIFVKEKTRVDD